MITEALEYALVSLAAILFFCAISVDPKGRATVYVGSPFFGVSKSAETDRDPTFTFFTKGSLVWSALLISLARLNSGRCSLNPETAYSLEAILGAATILVSTKILFGPVMEVRKTIRLVGENKFSQPLSFALYDAIRFWPTNAVRKFGWKLMYVSAMSLFVWVASFIYDMSSSDVIPVPLALAWILACLGRVASFIVHRRPSHRLQTVFFLATIPVVAVVWSLSETMMKGCGARPSILPSYESFAMAICGLPLAEMVAALVAAIF